MTEAKEITQYKQQLTFQERLEKSAQLIQKYPKRIPVVMLKKMESKIPVLAQYKFLLEQNLTIQNLVTMIRQNLSLEAKQSIFLIVNNKIPVGTQGMASIYQESKDEDGFLYIIYAAEDPFG